MGSYVSSRAGPNYTKDGLVPVTSFECPNSAAPCSLSLSNNIAMPLHLPRSVFPVGVQNITALGNLITWQKVDYDFNYHRMEFPCNINVLITSEGRSLLPVWTKKRRALPYTKLIPLMEGVRRRATRFQAD